MDLARMSLNRSTRLVDLEQAFAILKNQQRGVTENPEQRGNQESNDKLIRHAAKANADCRGMTMLSLSIIHDELPAFESLISVYNAPYDACMHLQHCSQEPIHLAAQYGRVPMVRKLIDLNVNLSLLDRDGRSAYERAVMNGHYEIVCMIKKALDNTSSMRWGLVPLAVKSLNKDVLRVVYNHLHTIMSSEHLKQRLSSTHLLHDLVDMYRRPLTCKEQIVAMFDHLVNHMRVNVNETYMSQTVLQKVFIGNRPDLARILIECGRLDLRNFRLPGGLHHLSYRFKPILHGLTKAGIPLPDQSNPEPVIVSTRGSRKSNSFPFDPMFLQTPFHLIPSDLNLGNMFYGPESYYVNDLLYGTDLEIGKEWIDQLRAKTLANKCISLQNLCIKQLYQTHSVQHIPGHDPDFPYLIWNLLTFKKYFVRYADE